MSFNTIKYYVCLNHYHRLWRTIITLFTLTLKPCLKIGFTRVNLQITLLRGYIHPNEQPVVLMILHLLRMRRNVNRNVYNAGKM